jgi:hypothetical protein
MKKMIYKSLSIVTLATIMFSCKPNIEVQAPTKGSLDVKNYVAIGNSYTSGYADNALYNSGQLVSYPNLIAQQLKLVGGGVFKQPLVSDASVGIGASMNARYVLAPFKDCQGVTSLAPVPAAQQGDLTIWGTSVAAQGPFNNMGVPGAKAIYTVFPGYGNPANGAGQFNPYFTRMTTDPANASILSDAIAQNPTFFSLAVGDDDALAFAIAGGASETITPAPAFSASIDAIVGGLTANGAKGVVANIPSISNLPYFTTIPYNGLVLDKANADALTAAYTPLGMTFTPGANPFVIEDASAPGQMRQIQQGEMILLSVPQDSLKCAGWGSMKPIPNQYVLTTAEITQINSAISSFNAKLRDAATTKGLAFVDMDAFFSTIKQGIAYNGIWMSAQFVQGGAFSLDGLHLTPLGNALMANEYIKAINKTYGSTIPQVDATKYKGVVFP